MRTLTVRLPATPRAASRTAYVLDWLCAHPYAGGEIRWAAVSSSEDATLDASGLAGAAPWFAEPLTEASRGEVGAAKPVLYSVRGAERELKVALLASAPAFAEQATALDLGWVPTVFFLLSRWEERLSGPRGPEVAEHWLVSNALAREPQADRLAEAALTRLQLPVAVAPSRVRYSHDLDHTRLFVRPYSGVQYAIWLARHGASAQVCRRLLTRQAAVFLNRAPDPFDNVNETLRPGGGILYLLLGRHVRQDGSVGSRTADLHRWLALASERGYRLGLHPSYTTAEYPERIEAEQKAFSTLVGEGPSLSRQHFLRWDWDRSSRALLAYGIEEDSTLGYRDRLGFRCGTSFPFRLYDFDQESASELWERPFAAMDTAWLEANAWDPQRCAADWADFRKLNARGAELLLNIHNSTYYQCQLLGVDLHAWTR